MKNKTIKMKNKIFATPTDACSIPEKPKIPATIARIKKTTIQSNIRSPRLKKSQKNVFDFHYSTRIKKEK